MTRSPASALGMEPILAEAEDGDIV
jgi:hypothetical protein